MLNIRRSVDQRTLSDVIRFMLRSSEERCLKRNDRLPCC
jgi:hypothetical protein